MRLIASKLIASELIANDCAPCKQFKFLWSRLFTVVNLVLCDENDELIAGALDLHYATQPHLNIKHLLVFTYLNFFLQILNIEYKTYNIYCNTELFLSSYITPPFLILFRWLSPSATWKKVFIVIKIWRDLKMLSIY